MYPPPLLKLPVSGFQSYMLSMTPHSKWSIKKMNYGRSIYIYTMHTPKTTLKHPETPPK